MSFRKRWDYFVYPGGINHPQWSRAVWMQEVGTNYSRNETSTSTRSDFMNMGKKTWNPCHPPTQMPSSGVDTFIRASKFCKIGNRIASGTFEKFSW